MCALTGEGKLSAVAIELRAPFDEFFNARRTFFDQHANGFYITKSVACDQGVLKMEADFVFVAEGGGDSSLSVMRC